jgi:hypothetical protein
VALSCVDLTLGGGMPLRGFYVTLVLFVFCNLSEGAQEKTLGEIRRELIGREVVVGGIKSTGIGASLQQDVLLQWHIAEGDAATGYKKKQIKHRDVFAPYELKGSRGTVISIELAENIFRNVKKGTSTDVFGEKIKDDTVANPYFDLVVRLKDGTLLITRSYYISMMGHLIQTSGNAEHQENEIKRNIDGIIGKTIYPVGYSTVYPQDIGIKEITDTLKANIYKLHDIPNLTPLKIVNAKYLEKERAVLLKVEFPPGRIGVILSDLTHMSDESSRKLPFLQKIAYSFLTSIPKEITRAEIEAIKNGSIIRGMSLTALHYSWGFPKKENDWGSTGKQLIYGDRLFVYVRDKKVVDWQALSR